MPDHDVGGDKTLAIHATRPSASDLPLDEASTPGVGSVDKGPTDGATLAAADRRLTSLAELKPNWDSYGGHPPTTTALALSAQVLSAVTGLSADGTRLSEPLEIAPVANGGVLLGWSGDGAEVELRIGPAGRLDVLYVEHPGGEPRYEEHRDISRQQAMSFVARAFGGARPG